MSFGWSPSDIVNLARLCYEVHNFCRVAPADLQGLMDRLDKIGQRLNRFSNILEKSGLGTWTQAPSLERDLHETKAFLEPFQTVINHASSSPFKKAKGLGRLALNKDKLRLIEENLDVTANDINDMKIDLIL
jgi:hypothetical protein